MGSRRVLLIAGCVAAASVASAARARTAGADPTTAHPARRRRTTFWQRVLAPNAAEIRALLDQAREIRQRADRSFWPIDYFGYHAANQRTRDRLLAGAESALERALELAPGRPALLLALGRVADDRERPNVAARALEQYLAAVPPAELEPDAELRLGRIYALTRRWHAAAAELELALGSPYLSPPGRMQAMFLLAGVAMRQRRTGDAIDLLRSATRGTLHRRLYDGKLWLDLALAVAYDRDEQITRARNTLDALLSTGGRELLTLLADSESTLHLSFVPRLDALYFHALEFEATGHLAEARAEWQAYAGGGADAVYRERARAHIADINRLLAQRMQRRRSARGGHRGAKP